MKKDVRKECFYCGSLVAERGGVGDHWPKPKSLGGTYTVDICTSCHDMKDRFKLEDWPMEWVAVGMKELIEVWPTLSRETRLLIGKFMSIAAHVQSESSSASRA